MRISATVAASTIVPAIVADAGDQAARRSLEFFATTIRNKNTRLAYLHAVEMFFAWCGRHRIGGLADHVAAYSPVTARRLLQINGRSAEKRYSTN